MTASGKRELPNAGRRGEALNEQRRLAWSMIVGFLASCGLHVAVAFFTYTEPRSDCSFNPTCPAPRNPWRN